MNKLVSTACVLICAGCAATEPSRLPSEEFLSERNAVTFAAMRADNAAGRTDSATAMATAMYWMGIKAALHPLPIDSAIAAREIGSLNAEGVDPELLRQGRLLADEMRAAGDSIESMPVFTILFRMPFSRWAEAEELARIAFEHCNRLDQMRPDLSARYGVQFPSLDTPKK